MYLSKLKNKKGFTLVELMIVVVIMGILVAVAVPVYGSVTKSVKKKVCHSNCDVIEKAVQEYVMNEPQDVKANFPEGTTITVSSVDDLKSGMPAKAQGYFKEGEFPLCPLGGSYEITHVTHDDQPIIAVICSEHGDAEGKKPDKKTETNP